MREARIPTEELMGSGHLACQGCGATMAMRFALKALGRKTVLVIPACCWSVIDGTFPHSAVDVPTFTPLLKRRLLPRQGLKPDWKCGAISKVPL
ncbi:hypothetical protein J7M07_05110 [bacterium]|nr:hypothetical protein [bacterium]